MANGGCARRPHFAHGSGGRQRCGCAGGVAVPAHGNPRRRGPGQRRRGLDCASPGHSGRREQQLFHRWRRGAFFRDPYRRAALWLPARRRHPVSARAHRRSAIGDHGFTADAFRRLSSSGTSGRLRDTGHGSCRHVYWRAAVRRRTGRHAAAFHFRLGNSRVSPEWIAVFDGWYATAQGNPARVSEQELSGMGADHCLDGGPAEGRVVWLGMASLSRAPHSAGGRRPPDAGASHAGYRVGGNAWSNFTGGRHVDPRLRERSRPAASRDFALHNGNCDRSNPDHTGPRAAIPRSRAGSRRGRRE